MSVDVQECRDRARLDIDPFSPEFLANPYPGHEELRDSGPVVWLSRYNIWGVARHAEVSLALQNWEAFCSGRGGGLTDFAKEVPWRPPSIILEADPPQHTRTRAVLAKVLSRPALLKLRERMEQEAGMLVDETLADSSFDAVTRLAQAFPLRVFPDAVGLVREGRENLLPYGDMAFNAFGPRNAILEHAMTRAGEVSGWIIAQCRRTALSADGFGAQIYAEVDAGSISEDEAALLVRSLLTAGLDTTIQGIAHSLHAFARFPREWQVLREQPALLRNAFEEVIRYASPVQTFFRTTTREVELGGETLPPGDKVLLFLAAANRDPRRWEDPNTFSVRRESAGHVGFGLGIHQCVGQMVARLESEVLMTALLRRVKRWELVGEPVFRLNNTLRTIESLPVRLERAIRSTRVTQAANLQLRVEARRDEALDVCSFELVDPRGSLLPAFQAGAHLDVHLGKGLLRQYSICSDPADRHRYRIAVLKERDSRGGSSAMHESVQVGSLIEVSAPKNHFQLDSHAKKFLLLAGGIGVTPLLSMAYALWARGADFELHYCAKSLERAAFVDYLKSVAFSSRVHIHLSRGQNAKRVDLSSIIAEAGPDADLYVCGPALFTSSALESARRLGLPSARLHSELFAAEVVHLDSDSAFEVELARTGRVLSVPKESTITAVLRANGIVVPVSCEQGVCGTCITRVLRGIPDHRDSYLTPDERESGDQFTPCCSRSKTSRLVIDL